MAVDRVRMSDVEKAYDFCFSHAAEVLPEIKRLSGKGMTKIIHAAEVLPRIKQRVFEHGETDDQMTPFERGKAWTFEFLSQPSSCINYRRKHVLFCNSRSKASFAPISGSHPW